MKEQIFCLQLIKATSGNVKHKLMERGLSSQWNPDRSEAHYSLSQSKWQVSEYGYNEPFINRNCHDTPQPPTYPPIRLMTNLLSHVFSSQQLAQIQWRQHSELLFYDAHITKCMKTWTETECGALPHLSQTCMLFSFFNWLQLSPEWRLYNRRHSNGLPWDLCIKHKVEPAHCGNTSAHTPPHTPILYGNS